MKRAIRVRKCRSPVKDENRQIAKANTERLDSINRQRYKGQSWIGYRADQCRFFKHHDS